MSDRYVMEALLRPAVELNTSVAAGCAAFVCVSAPWAVALSPPVSYVTAGGFAVLSSIRARQGLRILRYRRNLKRLPRYVMTSRQVPVSRYRLFLGKGFMWEQKHLQRLLETRRPEVQAFLQPSLPYRLARTTERWSEYRLPFVSQLLRNDSVFNPVRPLPPVGGKAPHLLALIDTQTELLRQVKQNAGAPEALLRKAATEQVLDSEEAENLNDAILESLRNAVRYDQKYFDKIVASLLPLLEKLTSGKVSALLSPDYTDMSDPRPLLDWQQVIRKKGIVYIGLDAMSDAEVASAVGNSMFADLVSVAGHIYKFGLEGDLPSDGAGKTKKLPISLHCDEFNELMGPEFIPMINKGGGAGIEVTAYTQTWSDIEARTGNAAKAAQVTGNFNTLVMLRVREKMTAELLTTQLPEVEVYTKTLVSGFTDISNPEQGSDFTSNTQDRVSSVRTPLLSTSELINLPKGQAFALLEGGRLWKIRMPLPSPENDDMMPPDMAAMVTAMRKNYRTGDTWWPVIATLPDNTPAQVTVPAAKDVQVPAGRVPGEGLNG
ncbi:conjugative transfer system coupling protein TraD [Salmonella enterica]|nr:conjugative transfer system coupling protein TraD [Salmonella enterica]